MSIAIEERDTAIAELETAKAKAELKLIESLTERMDTWYEVPYGDYSPSQPRGMFGAPYPPPARQYTHISDRLDGRFLPYYETEQDLRRMRAVSQQLAAFASTAIGAMDSLNNYTVGSGCTIDVTPTDPARQHITGVAKMLLDEVLEKSEFCGVIDSQLHDDVRTDGDKYIGIYEDEDGHSVHLDLLDAEMNRQPDNPKELERWLGVDDKLNAWWYGVHTQFDVRKQHFDHRPKGYHFVFDSAGDQWDYLPEMRCQQFKRNVPVEAPRGVSDYVPVNEDMNGFAKLKRNTTHGAAIQAAIAFIREYESKVTKDTVNKSISSNIDTVLAFDRNRMQGQTTERFETFEPGTVKDVRGAKYHAGPLGQLRSPIFIEVAQFVLRSIGIRWIFPEYMISGDASNSNFASTLVAESPFVKARESDQGSFARPIKRLCWKILANLHQLGRFGGIPWSEIRKAVQISVTFPEVASRDPLATAQTNQILNEKKILSLKTWSAQADLDWEEEQENIEAEPKQEPPMMFGMPGMIPPNGQPIPGQQPPQLQQAQQQQRPQPPQRAQAVPNQQVGEGLFSAFNERLAAAADQYWQGYP